MVEAAAEDTNVGCDEGVMVRARGESTWLLLGCCDPDCSGGNGEADDELRVRAAASELRSVDKGVRPRPAPGAEPGRPQADCCDLSGRMPELLLVPEATEL